MVSASRSIQKLTMERSIEGRFVFGGDYVLDAYAEKGLFNCLSSNPAIIEAAKSVDTYGLIEGHTIDIAAAVQAYAQAKLGTTVRKKQNGNITQVKTWVRLPRGYAPSSV